MKLHEMLGTKNRKEQERQVAMLVQASQAPVIDVVIRVDLRTSESTLTVIGGDPPIEFLYKLLDDTRRGLQQQERQATMTALQDTNAVTPPPPEFDPALDHPVNSGSELT